MSSISGLASVSKENALKRAAARKLGTQKKYKGKYAGPDKYKGEIPKHLQHKYKGKYFGKEAGKGVNPTVSQPTSTESTQRFQPVMDQIKGYSSKRLKTPEEKAAGQARLAEHVKARAKAKSTLADAVRAKAAGNFGS